MADFGIKVSKDGEDVKTKPSSYANIKKFSMISSVDVAGAGFFLLKVKASAKVTLANGANETVAHGLSYKPMFWVFLDTGAELKPQYYDTSGSFAYVDATNLVIENHEGSEKDFYYYIFYDAI